MTSNTKEIYTCPMHPEVQRDKPGICPECGMNLILAKKEMKMDHSMHDQKKSPHDDHSASRHSGHSTAMFFKKFWVSLILTIPVVLYADVFEKIFKWSPPKFLGSVYMPILFGSIVFFYGGWVFVVGAWREIQSRLPGMMTLISIAISAAVFMSLSTVIVAVNAILLKNKTLK